MDGAAAEGAAIIEFPTFAEAKAWYERPAYLEASQHRFRRRDYNAVIVASSDPRRIGARRGFGGESAPSFRCSQPKGFGPSSGTETPSKLDGQP